MSRKLNEIEDGLVQELMDMIYETGEIAIQVAERQDDELADRAMKTMVDFRRRFGMLCYNNRHRSKACSEAYKAIMAEARNVPEEELADKLGLTVLELRSKKDVEVMNMLFDVAES